MGTKRKSLTTDDLMRRQEGPRKRRKDTPSEVSEDESASSDLEDVRIGSDEKEGMAEKESGDDESGDGRRSEEESDADDDDSDEQEDQKSVSTLDSSLLNADDNLGSRISTKHVASKAKPSPSLNHASSPPKLTSFSALDISPPLVAALNRMAIGAPTEIQAACIPPLLTGRDCVGNAKTGSGKTIAFALPILQKLSVDPYGIFALVLTPTRELAFQIADQFAVLGSPLNVRTAVVVGGMDMMAQATELCNRPHVVVATPGRIVDHLKSSSNEWDLSRVKFLVLDEADRLLTSTFAPELAYLFNAIPKDRQTALFTATWTPSIDAIADATPRPGKQKPFIHKITASTETVETLQQHYILVPSHVRESYLYHLLCNPPESTIHLRRAQPQSANAKPTKKPKGKKVPKKTTDLDEELEQPPPTMIFCARARTAAYLTHLLQNMSIRSTALHSRLTQRERLTSLQLFRSSVVPVLITTDVGARGLDIEDVAMVINWDMPNEPEEYTHRVGRTARAGRGGVAISFVSERDEQRVLRIEDRIKTKLTGMELPEGKVLEKLNVVSTAKRLANMELHDSNFGSREQIHQKKKAKSMRDAPLSTAGLSL